MTHYSMYITRRIYLKTTGKDKQYANILSKSNKTDQRTRLLS